jgi:hypothetical protein
LSYPSCCWRRPKLAQGAAQPGPPIKNRRPGQTANQADQADQADQDRQRRSRQTAIETDSDRDRQRSRQTAIETDRGKALSLRGGGMEARLHAPPPHRSISCLLVHAPLDPNREIESVASRFPPRRDRALPLSSLSSLYSLPTTKTFSLADLFPSRSSIPAP